MQEWQSYFKGKRITVVGLGLLGRGVGDIRFLAEQGAELTVTDLKTEEALKPSLDALADLPAIRYVLGKHELEDFRDRDLILTAAGTPFDSPYLTEAKKNGIPVTMSTALCARFAKEIGATIVGVTGTRGKSTTTHLIAHALMHAGKEVLVGGNVRGVSSLSLLPEITKESMLVLELDSWQLQGFGEEKLSPDVAVFTNFMLDHLNYYRGDLERYFNDKANIFRFQTAGNALIAGEAVAARIREAHPPVAPIVPAAIPAAWQLKLLGAHNRENASLAAEALRALHLSEDSIRAGLESFEAVEGRLQLVRTVGGVKIYNDNNATTPDATIAALAALSPEKPVLIVGGADKKLPLQVLAELIPHCTRAVVLLSGTGTELLKPILSPKLEDADVPWIEAESLKDAVEIAIRFADGKGSILFSPGFASFGLFKNEYDRGDQFAGLVKKL